MADLAHSALEAMPEHSAPTLEDRRLLAQCLQGDPAAWAEFVRRHHPILEGAVRFTFHRCLARVPREDVENVVQDLYARLYEHDYRRLRSYEGRCPLAMWLKSLAVRHALNTIRDEKRRGRHGGLAPEDLQFRSADDGESPSPEERERAFRLGGATGCGLSTTS